MKVCPKCHAINDDDANFCKICGYRFPEEKTIRLPPPESTIKVKEIKTTLEEPITQPPTTQTPTTFTPPNVSPPSLPQPTSQIKSVQQSNVIRKKVIQKERRVIRTVTIIAIVVTVLLLTPLALNGVTIHYIPKGVTPLTTQDLDSILGGSWITTNISTTETASYVYTHILHTKDNPSISAYYQYFGYNVYDLVEVYLQFPNETLAKQFYLNYTKGVITASINTYPATVFKSSTAIAVATQFGNYFIYVEVYSVNGSPIPYTTTQIIQLIKNMEVI